MYELKPNAWDDFEAERDRAAENTQLFQVISVNDDTLSFEAYTAIGELYDKFDLIKAADGGPNQFVERKGETIAARRHNNTIPYEDQLPDFIRRDLMKQYVGYEFDGINFVDNGDFRGYRVELENGEWEINLIISVEGKILEEKKEVD